MSPGRSWGATQPSSTIFPFEQIAFLPVSISPGNALWLVGELHSSHWAARLDDISRLQTADVDILHVRAAEGDIARHLQDLFMRIIDDGDQLFIWRDR